MRVGVPDWLHVQDAVLMMLRGEDVGHILYRACLPVPYSLSWRCTRLTPILRGLATGRVHLSRSGYIPDEMPEDIDMYRWMSNYGGLILSNPSPWSGPILSKVHRRGLPQLPIRRATEIVPLTSQGPHFRCTMAKTGRYCCVLIYQHIRNLVHVQRVVQFQRVLDLPVARAPASLLAVR